MFSSRLLFSCSIRFPSDEWENFELNEGKKSRQNFSFPALPPVPRTYQKMLAG